jgi:ectoine hydroxylase-related dioxygenase (phytanoyl-CoA dioxygenase family)
LLGRNWVAGSGGVLAADSPRLLFRLFETYEEVGLRQVIAGYLGERPVLSANKCTLRRVPLTASTDWHQDGAFLGRGIRVLNVWIALTDCGVDAPGLDLLPRRFDRIVETGTGGAYFDWAVGPAVVERLAVDGPVVRPEFRAGDAVLFDEMYLHRTAIDATMTRPRYAIESWFFAPTSYPPGQVPLVW